MGTMKKRKKKLCTVIEYSNSSSQPLYWQKMHQRKLHFGWKNQETCSSSKCLEHTKTAFDSENMMELETNLCIRLRQKETSRHRKNTCQVITLQNDFIYLWTEYRKSRNFLHTRELFSSTSTRIRHLCLF